MQKYQLFLFLKIYLVIFPEILKILKLQDCNRKKRMTTKGKFLYFCKAIESGWIRKYLETMKTKWFSLLLVLLIAACQSNEIKYIDYHNERFGFDLSYPEFMTMDPPSANGDGISCHGNGLDLVAYGSMVWEPVTPYPQENVFVVTKEVDPDGTVHCKKAGRFIGTDNGEVILTLLLTYKQGEVDEKIIKTILEKFQHENVKI